MAYQARRSKKVIEEFELVDENNQVIERLHVEIDAGSMLQKIRQKYVDIIRGKQKIEELKSNADKEQEILEAYTVLGSTVCDSMEAVFGKTDAEKILTFYKEDYVELVKEVLPFITEVVLPKVNEIAKQNKKEILSNYNRRQKRTRLEKGMK